MKIAIYYNITLSGAKRVVLEQVKGLRALGNTVDVYTINKQKDIFDPGKFANREYIYDFTPLQINIHFLKRIKNDFIDTFYSLNKVHKKIARDIDKRLYDIVLVNIDASTQAPFLLRHLKTKKVYYCLEPLRNAYEYSLRLKSGSWLSKLYEDLNRWVRKKIDLRNTLSADYILTLSMFGRERIIAAYDMYPKILPLGVNDSVFRPLKVKKDNQVLFIAAKQEIFGYDLVQQALKLIDKRIRPDLKVLSFKKNNKVLSDVEIARIYNKSMVTLSLSKFDASGLVPLESLSCGTPVIALNVGGYREIVLNGKTGYLVEFDPSEIAEKIVYLMNNASVREKMGLDGRRWMEENWTWEKQIKRLNKMLEEFIDDK